MGKQDSFVCMLLIMASGMFAYTMTKLLTMASGMFASDCATSLYMTAPPA